MMMRGEFTLADLFWFSIGVRRGRRKALKRAEKRARRDRRGRYNGSRTLTYR